MSSEAFERYADRYDAWFDELEGSAIFGAEVACLGQLMPADARGWVEVGVGSGRFAVSLHVPEGIDPSPRMLEKAHELRNCPMQPVHSGVCSSWLPCAFWTTRRKQWQNPAVS